jgi:translation initiation factor IF-3
MIRAPQVRVIDADGKQAGIMSAADALRLAQSSGLDLVEVAATAQPPVCRIMNFDKYRYLQKKKSQGSKRTTSASTVKEVKMGARTDKHDVQFKVRHIRRFVGEGQRVKLSISLRGRENVHPELGQAMLDQVVKLVEDVAQAEGGMRREGRNLSIMLLPR